MTLEQVMPFIETVSNLVSFGFGIIFGGIVFGGFLYGFKH
jgi:hypothetical protein